jgi:hypothetical protein
MAWEAKPTMAKSVMALVALPRAGLGEEGELSGKVDSRWRGGLSTPPIAPRKMTMKTL